MDIKSDKIIIKQDSSDFYGNKYFPTNVCSCNYYLNRWIRFNPNNHKSIIIKAGTILKLPDNFLRVFPTDTSIDLSSYITINGKDYFIYIDNDGEISAYDTYQIDKNKIGKFHTLCTDVGNNVIMTVPASSSSNLSIGDSYLIKPYNKEYDPDFYTFYNKTITKIDTGKAYDIISCIHPLSGYIAGDILPESIFCLSFKPNTLYEDAMVYDKGSNKAIDIYIQSGTGLNTKSEYNVSHTISRQQINHMADMISVGKELLSDHEFTSAALGSNECTTIYNSADQTTVGGHKDTNNRRMISAIGCEEMCGYLWQWLRDFTGWTETSWGIHDVHGAFGKEYGNPYVMRAGGDYDNDSSCGSRSRASNDLRSLGNSDCGGRGSSWLTNQ